MEYVLAFTIWVLSLFGIVGDVGAPASPAPQETSTQAGVVKVVDGDTIVVLVNGKEETVRYIGIDTPEPYRDGEPACFSLEASLKNQELVAGKTIRLESDYENVDRYDRLLRYVYVDDVFVNAVLVEEGYAKSLTIKPNTSYASQFEELEKQAERERVGLWGECR